MSNRMAIGVPTPTLNSAFLDELRTKPVYCFTTDIDWAAEGIIDEMLTVFERRQIPLTPFVTHDSAVLRERYSQSVAGDAGVHPNFLPGSTHGSTTEEVIDHVVELWPSAESFRAHSFVDSALIARDFVQRGFRYDSNLCLHLQPMLVPLLHASGLVRFPIFLDDYYMASRGSGWDLANVAESLKSPGLKIFNFHPIHVFLNTPTVQFYEDAKRRSPSSWNDLVWEGPGARTLLIDLLDHIMAEPGLGILSLRELYEAAVEKPEQPSARSTGRPGGKEYVQASADERAEIVRLRYEQSDGTDRYATSRDFNLRELEIDFIAASVRDHEGLAGTELRILDVGCGNGYTALRVAKETSAKIIGVDFSREMVRGSAHLRAEMAAELQSVPQFMLSDVRSLPFEDGSFDVVISERCVMNLPDEQTQIDVIAQIARLLKPGGIYVCVEGTKDGLERLNALRAQVGLDPIPDRDEGNVSSLKFEESEIERVFERHFRIARRHYFGAYYLISRVVHPLLVAPARPRFDAEINRIARAVAEQVGDVGCLGHVMGYVLEVPNRDSTTVLESDSPHQR